MQHLFTATRNSTTTQRIKITLRCILTTDTFYKHLGRAIPPAVHAATSVPAITSGTSQSSSTQGAQCSFGTTQTYTMKQIPPVTRVRTTPAITAPELLVEGFVVSSSLDVPDVSEPVSDEAVWLPLLPSVSAVSSADASVSVAVTAPVEPPLGLRAF